MEEENKWENRIRMVLYSYPSDIEDEPHLTQWPKSFPMPRPWFKILDFGNKEIIAIGKDNNKDCLDVLVKSEFSEAYHWIEQNENPKNLDLYPHLNEQKDISYLDDLDGPTDEDLGRTS
mgnify:FL=1